MFAPGDKVKIVKSKELDEWKNKDEVIGKVGIISVVANLNGKIVYIIDDNKYKINFSGNSLRHTKDPVSKDEVKQEVKPGNVSKPEMPESLEGLLKELDGLLDDAKKSAEDMKKDLDHSFLSDLGEHMVNHCKRITKLEDSVKYLGIAIWVLVGYNIFTTIIGLLSR